MEGKKEGRSPRSSSVTRVFPLASFPGLRKFRTASDKRARPRNKAMFPLLSGWNNLQILLRDKSCDFGMALAGLSCVST